VRTNGARDATLILTAAFTGADVIVATATLDDESFTSNEARVTWASGKHTTFLTLNPSPLGGSAGLPVEVAASLSDASVVPPAAIEGAVVDFTLGGADCSGVTDANGMAACHLVPDVPGPSTLTAGFAGTAQFLPSSDAVGFNAVGGAPLGHFAVYASKQTKGTPKFFKFGPVTLGDEVGSADYDVLKPSTLAVPANKNGEGIPDPDTHLLGYAVKASSGAPKFEARPDVRFVNQCGEAVVTLKKPVSLLLPTAKDPTSPVPPPQESDHEVDHFLCYRVKAQKKLSDGTPVATFPKGVQVDVEDQFQSRRYDLRKIALACNPVSKDGSPTLLAGPVKGSAFPITPASIRNPAPHLLCYTATIAKKRIEQDGCGPASPGDAGEKIVPAQAKHVAQVGVHVANQFGSGQVDTTKERLVCIPSAAM
jgi:hypothetical protein